ncbi:MAG: ferritin-like domain-containing protein [Polyangiales bacterium]
MRSWLDPVADYLAQAAELEAASVFAFRQLARDLEAHRAPRPLVRAARRAAQDERHHTRIVGALARRFGARYDAPSVALTGARPLETLVSENAVEGCVRETFGALVATFQATRSSDPAVRGVMARIARDETRHAALAWRIARWAEPRLDRSTRARTAAARSQAIAELVAPTGEPAPELVHVLGLPTRAESAALGACLRTLT